MKYINTILLFLIAPIWMMGQILNPGFETSRDTMASLPIGWNSRMPAGYSWHIDSLVAHSGQKSLLLRNEKNSESASFAPFSQVVNLAVDKPKVIRLSVFMKTELVSQHAGLWCQLWDANDRQIGFSSLQALGISTSGSRNWTLFELPLTVGPDVKKLLIGGFLQGTGKVWYDDFSIKENISTELPSGKAARFIREAVSIAEKHSIVKDSLNWPQVHESLLLVAAGAKTINECYPAMYSLVAKLKAKGDIHSGFYPREYNQRLKHENLDPKQPESKYLGNSVAYINVPGFSSVNKKIGEAFATTIQTMIFKLDSAYTITKWIVDLRENTGGNMYPMIAGLGPLLGDDTLGYFCGPGRHNYVPWYYVNGASGCHKTNLCRVKNPYRLRRPDAQIVVLTGPNTASSGEMTLISFKGKPNATVIGSASAGYSTGNAGHRLADGSVLNLCESYCSDRHRRLYTGAIKPDVEVDAGDHDADAVLEYALKLGTD